MSWLEFFVQIITSAVRYLPWPIAISIVAITFKSHIGALLLRVIGIKYRDWDIRFGEISLELLKGKMPETTKDEWRLKQIVYEDPHYKLYSNGLLVQRLELDVPPNTETLFVVYPVAFPNEVISIQVVGEVDSRTELYTLPNCYLTFSTALKARKINLILSGI